MKRMELIGLILVLLFVTWFATASHAAEETPTITFAWEQDAASYELLTRWQLGVGDQPGGPYAEFHDIPKGEPADGETHQGAVDIVFTGEVGQTVTRYFILRACTTAEDNSCSAWSTEISHAETITLGTPQNFRKVSATVRILINPIGPDDNHASMDAGHPTGG